MESKIIYKDSVVRSIFGQCRKALKLPYKIELITATDRCKAKEEQIGEFDGACEHPDNNVGTRVFIHRDNMTSIKHIKAVCLHELTHVYFMATYEVALLCAGVEKQVFVTSIHEKDIDTLAHSLNYLIKVKEEDMDEENLIQMPKEFKVIEEKKVGFL